MNSIFQFNKVYSNSAFYAEAVDNALNLAHFYFNLYKDNPERCPWPKARNYCQKLINETKEVFTYFVPVYRTKNFLCFMQNGKNKVRRMIRKDSEGNEFVLISETALHANDLLNLTADGASEQYNAIFSELSKKSEFIRKMIEVEEYGYTFVGITKVTTEEELREFYSLNG